jgi:diaminohydroxyphosphoribosylaminopyrimidine deaminase/5-amino-6-(5-phosphoribosylamino)uracil reductase
VPLRVVLDARARLPLTSKLVQTARATPLLVVAGPEAPQEALTRLENQGASTLRVALAGPGRVDINGLLEHLGRERRTNILVEGGAEVLGALVDAQAIDEAHVFIAPLLLGGGRSALAGTGPERLADALRLTDAEVQAVGNDVYVRLHRAQTDAAPRST